MGISIGGFHIGGDIGHALEQSGLAGGNNSPLVSDSVVGRQYFQSYQRARLEAYNQIVSATPEQIDARSKKDLLALYNQGASPASISSALADAKEGKGIYGVNRSMEFQKLQFLDMPGMAQTVFATGTRREYGQGS